MAAETNMREVVERLRAEGSEAVLELVEFDQALGALLENLERIAIGTQDLHVATTNITGSGAEDALTWSAVQDQASRLSAWVSQFLVAFQQLQGAVQVWNIADARSLSSLPSSGKRLVPRD